MFSAKRETRRESSACAREHVARFVSPEGRPRAMPSPSYLQTGFDKAPPRDVFREAGNSPRAKRAGRWFVSPKGRPRTTPSPSYLQASLTPPRSQTVEDTNPHKHFYRYFPPSSPIGQPHKQKRQPPLGSRLSFFLCSPPLTPRTSLSAPSRSQGRCSFGIRNPQRWSRCRE